MKPSKDVEACSQGILSGKHDQGTDQAWFQNVKATVRFDKLINTIPYWCWSSLAIRFSRKKSDPSFCRNAAEDGDLEGKELELWLIQFLMYCSNAV